MLDPTNPKSNSEVNLKRLGWRAAAGRQPGGSQAAIGSLTTDYKQDNDLFYPVI
jgi:hypothetical protein